MNVKKNILDYKDTYKHQVLMTWASILKCIICSYGADQLFFWGEDLERISKGIFINTYAQNIIQAPLLFRVLSCTSLGVTIWFMGGGIYYKKAYIFFFAFMWQHYFSLWYISSHPRSTLWQEGSRKETCFWNICQYPYRYQMAAP